MRLWFVRARRGRAQLEAPRARLASKAQFRSRNPAINFRKFSRKKAQKTQRKFWKHPTSNTNVQPPIAPSVSVDVGSSMLALDVPIQNAKRAVLFGRPSEFKLRPAYALISVAPGLALSAFLAILASSLKAAASVAARSASTLRSSAHWAAFSPSIRRL